MWPRYIEALLGLWLVVSAFVFAAPTDAMAAWTIDVVAATLIFGLVLASHSRRLDGAHLLMLPLAIGLAIYAWMQPHPLAPMHQNHLLVALALALVSVVPSRATQPPAGWLSRERNSLRFGDR